MLGMDHYLTSPNLGYIILITLIILECRHAHCLSYLFNLVLIILKFVHVLQVKK